MTESGSFRKETTPKIESVQTKLPDGRTVQVNITYDSAGFGFIQETNMVSSQESTAYPDLKNHTVEVVVGELPQLKIDIAGQEPIFAPLDPQQHPITYHQGLPPVNLIAPNKPKG